MPSVILSAMSVEQPNELDQVRYAFRLGWAVAELRGRCRPDKLMRPEPPGGRAHYRRTQRALPLAGEREPAEVRIEIVGAINALADLLNLRSHRYDDVHRLVSQMEGAKAEKRPALWPDLTEAIYKLDAHIQDTLILPAPQAAGYQLGRALAETYWALYPSRKRNQTGSWQFVLGDERALVMRRLTARLSNYLEPLVFPAIDGPLDSWVVYARSRENVPGDETKALLALYRQGLLWRDLIRGERRANDLPSDPTTPTPSDWQVGRSVRLLRATILPLAGPIALALLAIAAIVLGAFFLARANHVLGTVIVSVLGALGVTSASLYASAKARIVSLAANLREAVATERIRRAANLCPPELVPEERGRLRRASQGVLAWLRSWRRN